MGGAVSGAIVPDMEAELQALRYAGKSDLEIFRALRSRLEALQNGTPRGLSVDTAATGDLTSYRSPSISSTPANRSSEGRERRHQVFAKGLDLAGDGENLDDMPPEPKSAETQALLRSALERTLYEPGADSAIPVATVLDWMRSVRYEAGATIITQGEPGDYFYVIESGRVRYLINGELVPHEGRGDSSGGFFGELALIYNAVRGATVMAEEPCLVWRLSRDHFREVQARASSNTFVQRCRWLQDVSLLSPLTARQLSRLAGALQPLHYSPGDRIVTQGEPGQTFFLIERGEVVCRMRSVLRERVRKMRARLNAVATFIMIARKAGLYRDQHGVGDGAAIPRGSLLRRGSSKATRIAAAPAPAPAPAPAAAAAPAAASGGDAPRPRRRSSINLRRFSLRRSSQVEAEPDFGRVVATLGASDYFGEAALLTNEPRNATVEASMPTRVLALDRSVFEELLGPLSELLDFNASKRILRMLAGLDKLSDSDIEVAARLLSEVRMGRGEQLYAQSEVPDTLYVIKEGSVKCVKEGDRDTEEWTLGPWMFVGERIFSNEPEEATSTTASPVRLMALSKANCAMLLNRAVSAHAVRSAVHYPPLHMLEEVAQLGRGGFGHVSMVRMEHASGSVEALAVKRLCKEDIVRAGQERHVLQEKQILASIPPHPFVVRLLATSQDAANLYMLTPLVQGGELFDLIHRKRGDNVLHSLKNVVFYAANVFLALEHLHKRDIAYRDLKPENLLLGETGYVTLVDMGAAKVIPYEAAGPAGDTQLFAKSFTLCGTPEYLAPEFVLNTGHDHAVDLWALGVLIYEMVFERTPFEDPDSDYTQLFSRICLAQVEFPPGFVEEHGAAANLVLQLLHKSPARRIGMLKGGAEDVRRHPCFDDLDWDELLAQKLPAPFVPELAGMFDTSCFARNASQQHAPSEPPTDDDEDAFPEKMRAANEMFADF